MRFLSLLALVATVSATELRSQAHAKGLKAPHPVRMLAQDQEKDKFSLGDAAGLLNSLKNAQTDSSTEDKDKWGLSDAAGLLN